MHPDGGVQPSRKKGKGMENSDANGIFQEGEKGLEKPVWYRMLSKKGLVK